MKYSAIPAAHTVVDRCKHLEIRQVVISPGSRNAPLILGFTEDPFFECFSLVDERSAGFFALGLSRVSGEPTALVCTSGSALLNYYPALAEAYYSRIPLIVLSADRPPYKVDIGDGQTIRQQGVFQHHIGFQASLMQDLSHATSRIRRPEGPLPEDPEALSGMQHAVQRYNEKLIAEGILRAREERMPVHLNIPFEEPLYATVPEPPVNPGPIAPRPAEEIDEDWEQLRKSWQSARKKMVLIGAQDPGLLSDEAIARLAADPSVLVFTETTSNVHHPAFFPSIDSIIAPLELKSDGEAGFKELQPEVLLTLGGMVVSKKVKQFLRRYPPREHWHADPLHANDTFYCLSRHLRHSPDQALKQLLSGNAEATERSYRVRWETRREAYRERRSNYLSDLPFSDFSAFHCIFDQLPAELDLHLGNSSTVRYAQLFEMNPEHRIYCNRGTSGIEGSTATAAGASWNSDRPSLLICGDLSALYDANGLWHTYLRPDFRMIVINNGGGGIFRILPGDIGNPNFIKYFETRHGRSLEPLCELNGMDYLSADSGISLSKALETLFEEGTRPRLLEVFTPSELNDRILLGYFEFLS